MEWCNFSRQEVFCSLIIERTVWATESDCNNFEDGRNETLIRRKIYKHKVDAVF